MRPTSATRRQGTIAGFSVAAIGLHLVFRFGLKTDAELAGLLLYDLPLEQVAIGDMLVIFPHEVCPVDGTVLEGRGVMDESYLTGEPYMMSKTPGSQVLSGAINGEAALTIRADKLAVDSRYAKIMQV